MEAECGVDEGSFRFSVGCFSGRMEVAMGSLALLLAALLLWNATLVVFAQPGAADALRAFRFGVGDPPQLRSWRGDPCLVSWRGVKCGLMNNVESLELSALGMSGFISSELENLHSLGVLWLDGNHLTGPIPPGLGKLKNLTSLRLSGNNLHGQIPPTFNALSKLEELFLDGNQLTGGLPFLELLSNKRLKLKLSGNADLCSSSLQYCGPSLAPALVFGEGAPQSPQKEDHHRSHVGPIIGAVFGALVLVAMSIGLVSFCLMRVRRRPSATSETASDPSVQEWAKGAESEVGIATALDPLNMKQFTFQELDHATKSFNSSNMIGRGRFGFVYKGLLEDGTIVAIKMRTSSPTQEFVAEVVNLSQIRHRNLLSLLGFCQEQERQMLVYDYLHNGSVCSHLYDINGFPTGELDLKQRLSIALDAAKGLEHLHLENRLHQGFKTSNVLLDENLMAKVADFGLSNLLVTAMNGAGTSGFSDPAAAFDVYSYGVFLFELISGQEAVNCNRPQASRSIVDWAWSLKDLKNIEVMADVSLVGASRYESVRALLLLGLHCTAKSPERRPSMCVVAKCIEQIMEKERTVGGAVGDEGSTIVTLGSELFT